MFEYYEIEHNMVFESIDYGYINVLFLAQFIFFLNCLIGVCLLCADTFCEVEGEKDGEL